MGINEANAEGGRALGEVDQGALLEVEEGLRRLLTTAPRHEEDPPDPFVATARSDLGALSAAASEELTRYCHRELGRLVRCLLHGVRAPARKAISGPAHVLLSSAWL